MRYKKEKEKDISIQDFINFLKINNVYKQFRRGFSTPCKDEFFRNFCQNSSKEDFSKRRLRTNYDYLLLLSDAFRWSETAEGWDFWKSVSNRWIEKYFK
jgi:hypothetical protein